VGGSKKVKALPPLPQTLLEPQPQDVLELDELWLFVAKPANKQWVWLALCRRTRQVVAYAVGDRSEIHMPTLVGPHPAGLPTERVLHRLLECLREGKILK